MSRNSTKLEKLDVFQPLPSNLDVLPRERIVQIASDLGIGSLTKDREHIIRRIRRVHTRRRLEKIRKTEQRERLYINRSVKRDWAKKRLMKDLKEIQTTELNYVCAAPLRNDIFEWHVNVLSPRSCRYYPMVLHLILKFSEEYPLKPPECELVTPMHHSHVFSGGKFICLDLLETHYTSSSYHGWSSSYSVLSIIFQLQSFFFEDKDTEKDYRSDVVRKDILKSTKVSCRCGHHPSTGKVFPTWSYWGDDVKKTYFRKPLRNVPFKKRIKSSKKEEEEEEGEIDEKTKGLFNDLPNEILLYIFQFLDPRVFLRFSKVSKAWRRMVYHPYLWKDELKCYHTKLGFREDCLGIGLNIQKKFKKIHQVSTPLDILSRHAFVDQKVRKSPWNVPFNYWMPLFIDGDHWEKSRKYFETLVAEIYYNEEKKEEEEEEGEEEEKEGEVYINVRKVSEKWKKPNEFKPYQAVDFCCKVMTSMVVEIMKGELHGSIKAIQGYSYFYRILIYYVTKFPFLRNEIDYNIGKFIQHERFRHKRYVPNLGDFISLLSVSRLFSWDDVRDAFIDEVFDRNTFWMNKKFDILFAEEGVKKNKKSKSKKKESSNNSTTTTTTRTTERRVQRRRRVNDIISSSSPRVKVRTEAEQDRKRRYRQRKRKLKSEMKKLRKEDPQKYEEVMRERREQHELLQRRSVLKKSKEEEKELERKRKEVREEMERKRKMREARRKEEEERRMRNEKMRKNIRVSFRCVEVSLRFTLFHLSFLKRIRDGDKSTIEKISEGYDRRFGNEDLGVMNELQKDVFEVQQVDCFQKFFKCSGYTKLFDAVHEEVPPTEDKKKFSEFKREKILEKLEVSDKNFRRRRYNRRIDTSGSILTGNFKRSIEEVKKMLSSSSSSRSTPKRKSDEVNSYKSMVGWRSRGRRRRVSNRRFNNHMGVRRQFGRGGGSFGNWSDWDQRMRNYNRVVGFGVQNQYSGPSGPGGHPGGRVGRGYASTTPFME